MHNRRARLVFASAILLLLLAGVSALFTFVKFESDQGWVTNTHAVRDTIDEIEANLTRASRARLGFVLSGNQKFLVEYDTNARMVPTTIQELRELSKDNPIEQQNCSRLEALIKARIKLWQQSIELRKARVLTQAEKDALTAESVSLSAQTASVTDAMKNVEGKLLTQRKHAADIQLRVLISIVLAAFSGALLLFLAHYRLLIDQLKARLDAEQDAKRAQRITQRSQEAARQLSLRLLAMQDEERRRIARELHDSLGQYLVGLKMSMSQLSNPNGGREALMAESMQLLDRAIAETRTLSYLLHPPMLDEAGFASAAEWYVNGFAQRSGIAVKVEMPKQRVLLSPEVELALFRILQESLTNIHKHSKSTSAEVALSLEPQQAILTIRDYGQGIPAELLASFRMGGSNVGVGLSGMRERMRQLGGQLAVESSDSGTIIRVSVPIEAAENEAAHGQTSAA
jgi:signal transduction histidine kinase